VRDIRPAEEIRHHAIALPFIVRKRESAALCALHAQRKHVLILGPSGVGKSALVAHLRGQLPLLLCPHSECLGEICDNFEMELGLGADDMKLVKRKQRLRQALAETGKTVVFDGLGWTTPKLSSFLESVMERVPVWLCARSEYSWDIGHFWTLLGRFARVELRPFQHQEAHSLVSTAVERGIVPGAAMGIVGWLYRTSAGNPGRLCKLLTELANGHYDVCNPCSLRRLKLDCRIHAVFPAHGQGRPTPSSLS